MRFGWLELAIVLVIVFIIFGVGKLPQVSEALGRVFKSLRGKSEGDEKSDSAGVRVIRKLEDDATSGPVKK